MVRWRCTLFLALLLLMPARIEGKLEEEDEEENVEGESEENESEEDDEAEESTAEKTDSDVRRRLLVPTPKTITITRTTVKRPIECYVCAYKIESQQIRACLDPTKHRVHTMTCHSVDDKCFTTVMNKNSVVEALVRGCRSGCTGATDTTCCEINRCNSQAYATPMISPRALPVNKGTKSIPTTVLFFVTILLFLQTVVKVAFV